MFHDRLHEEAERQGLVVRLELTGRREQTRISRVAVVDRSGSEVGALRLTRRRDLERASAALLRLLEHRAATDPRKV